MFAAAIYPSMAIFVSHGNATSSDDSNRIKVSARATYRLYGRKYATRRRMSLESYAFPSTSSSCITFLQSLAYRQFLFQQLPAVQFGVISATRQKLRVAAPLD